MPQIWSGVDIGKTHHHCVVVDAEGKRLLSRRVRNDGPELLALLADMPAIDEDTVGVVDVADGIATLLISVLLNHGQQLLYIPGLAVNRASAGYRGTGKTDAKDATVVVEQVRCAGTWPFCDRMTSPPSSCGSSPTAGPTRTPTAPAESTACCSQLTSTFAALERSLDGCNIGPLILLTGCQTRPPCAAPAASGWRRGSGTAMSAGPKPSPQPFWRQLSAARRRPQREDHRTGDPHPGEGRRWASTSRSWRSTSSLRPVSRARTR